MTHSPFPWKLDPRIPTAVFDANGNKLAATKEGHAFHPRDEDDTTAADNAALIAAVPVLVEALEPFRKAAEIIASRPQDYADRIVTIGGLATASDLTKRHFSDLLAALASIGRKS